MPAFTVRFAAAVFATLAAACGAWTRVAADDLAPPGTDAQAAAPGSEARPLWEAGVGAVVGAVADYPGSNRYQVRGLPLPYFTYRGDVFRSDSSGPRVRTGTANVEFEVSGGGSLSSDSQSGARAGMPKLDYLLEAGPKAKITVARPSPSSRLLLDLPVRAAASTDFVSRFHGRGLVFAPDVTYEDRSVFGSRWNMRAGIGIEAATVGLQRFYYEVAPQYALPGRPAYRARGGYLGAELTLSAFRPLTQNLSLFVAVDVDSYRGAADERSPLVKTRGGYGAAVGFAWSLFQSKARTHEEFSNVR